MKKLLAIVLLFTVTIAATSFAKENKTERIQWEFAGALSPAAGFDKNIGIAGVLYGVDQEYIIVGGGANFPYDSVLNGGAKKTYPDVYVLKKDGGQLKEVDHAVLDHEIGYGSSVTTEKGVYYLGGSTDTKAAKTISLFNANKQGKLQVTTIGALPFSFQNGVAVAYQDSLYLGLGKQDGKTSQKFYRYDLTTKQITELPAFPGKAREQSVAQVLSDKLYVFSGGSETAFTDGYQYDFAKNIWAKAASVNVDGREISLLGASAVKLNDTEMMVIGGFDKQVYDNAVANLTTLTGEKLTKFKESYFNADPEDFHWNKEILIYQATTNTWRSLGQVPFYAPCGAGFVLLGDTVASINGEIKPGVRSNRMYLGTRK